MSKGKPRPWYADICGDTTRGSAGRRGASVRVPMSASSRSSLQSSNPEERPRLPISSAGRPPSEQRPFKRVADLFAGGNNDAGRPQALGITPKPSLSS